MPIAFCRAAFFGLENIVLLGMILGVGDCLWFRVCEVLFDQGNIDAEVRSVDCGIWNKVLDLVEEFIKGQVSVGLHCCWSNDFFVVFGGIRTIACVVTQVIRLGCGCIECDIYDGII